MARIVAVGEGMIELSRDAAGTGWRLGHGGDTLNTAIHFARFGEDVAYLSAIGDDPFSRDLRDAWVAEGIDPSLLLVDPDRRPGLYAITIDPAGERHFTYWREDSAARRLFALRGIDEALSRAEQAELLFFSMITLAILPANGRDELLALAERIHVRGGRVAFDSNYRPALWPDAAEARAAHARALAVADIGLPTLEDEIALFGVADAHDVLDHWRGLPEVVVKLGAAGCLVGDTLVPPPRQLQLRDTSGAGDAFDAGYLHARLAGRPPRAAALAGHNLAGWTVMHPGAIPARTLDAPYAIGQANLDRSRQSP